MKKKSLQFIFNARIPARQSAKSPPVPRPEPTARRPPAPASRTSSLFESVWCQRGEKRVGYDVLLKLYTTINNNNTHVSALSDSRGTAQAALNLRQVHDAGDAQHLDEAVVLRRRPPLLVVLVELTPWIGARAPAVVVVGNNKRHNCLLIMVLLYFSLLITHTITTKPILLSVCEKTSFILNKTTHLQMLRMIMPSNSRGMSIFLPSISTSIFSCRLRQSERFTILRKLILTYTFLLYSLCT